MYEVQIKKSGNGYVSRFKRTSTSEQSQPFAAARTREVIVKVAELSGMRVVSKWS